MEPQPLPPQSFQAAVPPADPLKILPAPLPHPPSGETLVVGAGKAAASMALAVERHWPRDAALEGLVITRYRHGLPTRRVKVIEAGHPVPDETGESAAKEILQRVRRLSPSDLLLALISGGGSALLSLPVEAVGMEALKATTRELLRSGAPIQDINAVRKHLSAIQAGRLPAAQEFFHAQAIHTMNLGDSVTGEASEVAKVYAALARQIAQYADPMKPPVALISGGECTVTVRGNGRGGRCSEFLLSLGIELAGIPNVCAIACDTDGIDGSEDNAGAVLLPESLVRGARLGLDAGKLLADNDAYGFFSRLEDLVVTRPTQTHVND